MENFNAPKNFKRGRYILGRFRIIDVLIIVTLVVLSVFFAVLYLNLFISEDALINVIFVSVLMLPILIAYVLFIPMNVYFNILDLIKSFIFFQQKQKKYKWEGIHQFESEEIKNEKEEQ